VDWIVTIGIFLGGGIVSGLISYGWHKREHRVLSENNTDMKKRLDNHEQRHNQQDVTNATILTSLKYLIEKVDEVSEKLDRPQ
jgi:hypothetical protein